MRWAGCRTAKTYEEEPDRNSGTKFQGWVVRKPVNTNPGLKCSRSIDFSCIKMFYASNFLSSLRLFKLKREGQTIQTENLSVKLQD